MTMPWGAKKKIAFLCVHESLFCTSYRKTCIQFKVRLIKVNKDFFSKKNFPMSTIW